MAEDCKKDAETTVETPLLHQPQLASINTLEDPSRKKREWLVLLLMLLVICAGAANSVARKIMTKPMGNYSLFVTLFSAAAYFLLYNTIFLTKACLGLIPRDSCTFPWKTRKYPACKPPSNPFVRIWRCIPPVKYFVIIGFLECFGNILSVVATQYLTGPMVSLLGQTTIFFSMVVSFIMFRTKYSWLQVMSVFVVVGGAMIPLVNDLLMSDNQSSHAPAQYYIIMAISNLPMTISFGIKEMIFRREKKLDVFVVNSTGSMFQLLWWPVALPMMILLDQTGDLRITTYLRFAFECFTGTNPPDQFNIECGPNPYPYLIYLALNIIFNIFVLLLIKRASAVQSFMALNGVLPVAIVLFCAKWPLIGKSTVNIFVIASLITVMIGLVFYRWSTVVYERRQHKKTQLLLNATGESS